jgi:hypothetical protein
MAQTTIRIDAGSKDAVDRLKLDLRRENGLKASRDEIVAALVCGVSAPQAAGMLVAYIKHATDISNEHQDS